MGHRCSNSLLCGSVKKVLGRLFQLKPTPPNPQFQWVRYLASQGLFVSASLSDGVVMRAPSKSASGHSSCERTRLGVRIAGMSWEVQYRVCGRLRKLRIEQQENGILQKKTEKIKER